MVKNKCLFKRVLVLGSAKQRRDLQFVFHIEHIIGQITKISEMEPFHGEFDILLVCEGYEGLLHSLKEYSYEIMYDKELIELLSYPLSYKVKKRKIAIWGFGELATRFTNQFIKRKEWEFVDCYFDNDERKVGLDKNGISVRKLTEMNPEDYFVIIATNHVYFDEISEQLRRMGCDDENDFVHYSMIDNDSMDLFYKTYREEILLDATCKNLDRTLRINRTGDVCICCMAYEGILGNLYFDRFESIWNSMRANVVRLSLMNRTFSFCDKDRCPFLSGKKIMENMSYDKAYSFPYIEYPDCIAPEIDYSCNLYCTSCRNEILIEKNKERMDYSKMIVERLTDIPSRFLINTVGEVFASENCKYILEHPKIRKRDQISIYTNGTLMNEKILKELIATFAKLEFSVSVDAATEDTYKKIRRGGSFERLMHTMNLLGMARKENEVTYLQVNFVVQADNISEMEEFVKLAKTWNVDRIAMNGLEQWGSYTDEEYEKKSIWRDGDLKEEFRHYFTKELVEDETINFFNISNYIGAEPKFMYMI